MGLIGNQPVSMTVRDADIPTDAAITASTKCVTRTLQNKPCLLTDFRVWDALDMPLPGGGNVESGIFAVSYSWDPNSADDTAFVAAGRAFRVVGIIATVEVAGTDGGAVTLAVKKAASGTDIASGTALHTSTVNLKGTVDTNQSMTLSSTSTDLDIPSGTRIGCDFTGTLTAARGCVTILLAPAGSGDDLRLVTQTYGTSPWQIQTGDLKAAGSTTRRAAIEVYLDDRFVAQGGLKLRCVAGMKTTVADTTATIDVEAYRILDDGTLSSDLVSDAAQSINSLTYASKDFTVDTTNLSAGDRLDVRVSIAVNDAASGTAVIGLLHKFIPRMDLKP